MLVIVNSKKLNAWRIKGLLTSRAFTPGGIAATCGIRTAHNMTRLTRHWDEPPDCRSIDKMNAASQRWCFGASHADPRCQPPTFPFAQFRCGVCLSGTRRRGARKALLTEAASGVRAPPRHQSCAMELTLISCAEGGGLAVKECGKKTNYMARRDERGKGRESLLLSLSGYAKKTSTMWDWKVNQPVNALLKPLPPRPVLGARLATIYASWVLKPQFVMLTVQPIDQGAAFVGIHSVGLERTTTTLWFHPANPPPPTFVLFIPSCLFVRAVRSTVKSSDNLVTPD
ncbi:unnamed protein product [Mesocestoides corti]|uniref:Uncharacterized protein n=1 Tax=Mesocestoides corti TaxID=53468 RepID=A0A0R3UIQ1_MESCO|nr:unnamed protein product [Mesocestoides corti]